MQATPNPSGKLALPQVISNRPYPPQITTLMFTFTVAFILALVVIPTLSHPLDIPSLRTHDDVLANREVPGHGLRLSSPVLCPRKSIVVDIQREQELARLRLTTDRRIQDLQAHLAGETAALRGGASAKSGKSAKAGKRTNTGKGTKSTKSQGTGAFLKAYETPERRIATIAKHFSREFDGESGEVRKVHSLI